MLPTGKFPIAKERLNPEVKLPGNLAVAGTVLLTSAGAFAIRLILPIGTDLMNMLLSFFSSYIILFISGIIAIGIIGCSEFPDLFNSALRHLNVPQDLFCADELPVLAKDKTDLHPWLVSYPASRLRLDGRQNNLGTPQIDLCEERPGVR